MNANSSTLTQFRNLISNIKKNIMHKHEDPIFQVGIHQFQLYLTRLYQKAIETNRGKILIDDIFSELGRICQGPDAELDRFTNNRGLFMIILYHSLLSIPLGDKIYKANQIVKSIITIPPSSDSRFFTYLDEILAWLSGPLRNSMQMIMSPLRTIVLQWYEPKQTVNSKLAALQLLTLIAERNANPDDNFFIFVAGFFLAAFQTEGLRIRSSICESFKSILALPHYNKVIQISEFAQYCMSWIQRHTNDIKMAEWTCDPIEIILDSHPELAKHFSFTHVPVAEMNSADPKTAIVAYRMIPLVYRSRPELFTPEVVTSIFSVYSMLIKKNCETLVTKRTDLLNGLNHFVFARFDFINSSETDQHKIESNELAIVEKCKVELCDNNGIDCPEAAAALIAILCYFPDNFEKEAPFIFNAGMTTKMVTALNHFLKFHSRWKIYISRRIVSYASTKILKPKLSNEEISYLFTYLLDTNIPTNVISLPFILQCGTYLTGDNALEARETVANFILDYQNRAPSVDIIHLILSAIATEVHPTFRLKLMTELKKEPDDESIVPSLQSLLHDLDPAIRKESLKYLCDLSQYQSVKDLLNDFISEKLHDLVMSSLHNCFHKDDFVDKIISNSYRELIETMLIVANSKSGKQLLSPFAKFLITHLLETRRRMITPALQLLARIIPLSPDSVDNNIPRLAQCISNILTVHATQKQLDAAHQLFVSALQYTDLRFTIYTDQLNLYFKFLEASKLVKDTKMRSDFLKTIGSIGAINPTKITEVSKTSAGNESFLSLSSLTTANSYLAQAPTLGQDSYQALTYASVAVVLLNLLAILKDESLSTLHELAIEKLLQVLKSHRSISDDLESELLQQLNSLLSNSSENTVIVLLANIVTFITVLGEKFAPLIPRVIDLVEKYWNKMDRPQLIRICEWMKIYVSKAFIPYIQRIITLFISDFDSNEEKNIEAIISACETFGSLIKSVDHILFPHLLTWIQNHATNQQAISTILLHFKKILAQAGATKFATQIIRTLLILKSENKTLQPELNERCLEIFYVIAAHTHRQFLLHLPLIRRSFDLSPEGHKKLFFVLKSYEKGEEPKEDFVKDAFPTMSQPIPIKGTTKNFNKEEPDPPSVKKPESNFTDSKWSSWSDEFFTTLIEHCPARAIAACTAVAERHSTFRDSVTPLAFCLAYCLYEKHNKSKMQKILKMVFSSHDVPRHVIRTFLSITELFEVLGIQCPVPMEHIAQSASSADRIAQSLRAHEYLFQMGSISSADSLIIFNQTLGLPLAANGILQMNIQGSYGFGKEKTKEKQGEFAERLGLWENALKAYNEKLADDPTDTIAQRGRLNCLKALLRFEDIKNDSAAQNFLISKTVADLSLFNTKKFYSDVDQIEKVQGSFYKLRIHHHNSVRRNSLRHNNPKKTHSSNSNRNSLPISSDTPPPEPETIVESSPIETDPKIGEIEDPDEALYYRAFARIMRGDEMSLHHAEGIIKELRLRKVQSIFPMISENYERVYSNLAMAANISELEEVIEYKRSREQLYSTIPTERTAAMNRMQRAEKEWALYFSQLAPDPVILHNSLCIHALALDSVQLLPQYIYLIDTMLKTGHLQYVNLLLKHFQSVLQPKQSPDIELLSCRFKWAQNQSADAISSLESLISNYTNSNNSFIGSPDKTKVSEMYRYLGIWQSDSNDARESLSRSVANDDHNISSWQLWAKINFSLYESTKEEQYLVDSFDGSLHGLELSSGDPLSFTLKILSTLFRRGRSSIYKMFTSRARHIPISVWLDVLPQIIARSSSTDQVLHGIISDLIYDIGMEHPHDVLYSLMVPYMTNSAESARRKVAEQLFNRLQLKHPDTVRCILDFTHELIRASVSWWEMWNTELDEASRAYMTRHDFNEMIGILDPLHEEVGRKAETYHEVVFMRQFGAELQVAGRWLSEFKASHYADDAALSEAWLHYINVFHQLKGVINEMKTIQLIDASPVLYNLRSPNLSLPGDSRVMLARVDPTMQVMLSKQRPRRMAIYGSDGVKYTFLLKAHEDTRLDERVMQFFALLNTIMEHSAVPMKEQLSITTYKVIPLTGKVGLIGWLKACSTVYDLVKDFRVKRGIPLEFEYQQTMQIQPKFETLDCSKKEELAMKESAFTKGFIARKDPKLALGGKELKMMLFANAVDSNHWLERRTNYSTSLAMTSISGYILGLGDRHLCNIMSKLKTGKLVHIDFGDCFEVAQHREKFPEKVPFRLTHILQNALEASGIEGTFRSCAENVMNLARTNREQILGLLEVFIYDPLLQMIENETDNGDQESPAAVAIVKRIQDKLEGNDFEEKNNLDYKTQVDLLIKQAIDHKNLCQMFRGWFPWW